MSNIFNSLSKCLTVSKRDLAQAASSHSNFERKPTLPRSSQNLSPFGTFGKRSKVLTEAQDTEWPMDCKLDDSSSVIPVIQSDLDLLLQQHQTLYTDHLQQFYSALNSAQADTNAQLKQLRQEIAELSASRPSDLDAVKKHIVAALRHELSECRAEVLHGVQPQNQRQNLPQSRPQSALHSRSTKDVALLKKENKALRRMRTRVRQSLRAK